MVDVLGLLLVVMVHAAGMQERDGANPVLRALVARLPGLQLIWADGGYAGKLVPWVATVRQRTLAVHCVSPAPVPSWERRAPARLQKPRWRVALPGTTLENWWGMYETDIEGSSNVPGPLRAFECCNGVGWRNVRSAGSIGHAG